MATTLARRAVLALPLAILACIPVFSEVEINEFDPSAAQNIQLFEAPVRAYLTDGSIVVLPRGGMVSTGTISGSGWRYPPTLSDSIAFTQITTDSVIGVEVFDEINDNELATVAGGIASAALVIVGAAGLAVAIFGSCPTIYAHVEGEPAIQMEAFSYSIAPLFEARDVATLPDVSGHAGLLELELRNEALETHYINQIELLSVSHTPRERSLPDPSGRPILIGPGEAPTRAVDREGRDISSLLALPDEVAFRSDRARLAAVTVEDLRDYVDLVVPVPEGESEITLALRVRNTLLNSLLFYDIMLADAGVGALDWLGKDLDRIGEALDLGEWYQDRLGMRVLVEERGRWREVTHLSDVGPIAWKEVAVPIRFSTREGGQVRVRLEFVADSWFVDRVEVSGGSRRPDVTVTPLARVVDPAGAANEDARDRLRSADDDYFVTRPGQRFTLEFDVPPANPGETRTVLLGTQGYYVEWVRGAWLGKATSHEPFEPSDPALLEALRRWNEKRDQFELDFHATRIPVR